MVFWRFLWFLVDFYSLKKVITHSLKVIRTFFAHLLNILRATYKPFLCSLSTFCIKGLWCFLTFLPFISTSTAAQKRLYVFFIDGIVDKFFIYNTFFAAQLSSLLSVLFCYTCGTIRSIFSQSPYINKRIIIYIFSYCLRG